MDTINPHSYALLYVSLIEKLNLIIILIPTYNFELAIKYGL